MRSIYEAYDKQFGDTSRARHHHTRFESCRGERRGINHLAWHFHGLHSQPVDQSVPWTGYCASMKEKLAPDLQLEQPALRVVTLKVAKVNGINLGQGVCRMPVPDQVKKAAHQAIEDGKNLYCPAAGIPEAREAIAKRLKSWNKILANSDNVMVTTGATGAFEVVCDAFLRTGDEVVSFVPYYPYHHNTLTKAKAIIRYVKLHEPDWSFDVEELKRAITKKTKFILINTPNNPTGKVFSRTELETIAELCKEHNLFCVTDEVYEYMTYDEHTHLSMASLPGMFERTITIGSYSKTFAITGWRVGYLAAPAEIVDVLRCSFDRVYVCTPTPFQWAVAEGINQLGDEYYAWLKSEYTRKRALMRDALLKGGLTPHQPQGAYYILASTRERFPNQTSDRALDTLIERAEVGAVPASDFVGEAAKTDPSVGNFFRFCFAVPDELIIQAGNQLARL